MKKILILFAHPAFPRSKINAALRGAVDDLPDVVFHDLYANYPDFLIDVRHEQQLCANHDIIIFQHPLYWYSAPAILKEWTDLVLQYGWAYGGQGNALAGKLFFQALTAGGDSDAYQHHGSNKFTMAEITSPFQAMANLCRMKWLPPFAVLGIHSGLAEEKIHYHAAEYRRTIIALRDECLDIEKAISCEYLNSNLDLIISRS